MRHLLKLAAVGATLGILALSPAFAQSTSQGMAMRGMMGGGCPMMAMMGQDMMGGGRMRSGMMQGRKGSRGMMRGHAQMGAMAEGRLAYLKAELKLTSAQEAAWGTYASAVRSRVDVMRGMRQTMMEKMETGNAIGRIEARISGMEAMVESMKAVKPATEKLYAVLDDKQKEVADQLIGMHCGAM